jgi:DNA excision repair protein ERCC-4
MVRIVVDDREKPSGVPDALRSKGASVEFRVLEVADYIVGEYAVERKSVRDFVSSLFSGRLFDQAYRIGESYRDKILVVEGSLDNELNRTRNPRSLWGALISAVLDFDMHCFFTRDPEETAEFLITLGKGGRYKGRQGPPPLVVRKPRSEDMKRLQEFIVSSVPGVGPRTAEQLLSYFGSLRRTFAASVTEMSVGAGIGKTKALKVRALLDASYKPSKGVHSQTQLREEA